MDMFVTVHLLEDTPAVLSLGKHGRPYEWKVRQTPNLVEMTENCKSDNHVVVVVPGLSSEASSFSSTDVFG